MLRLATVLSITIVAAFPAGRAAAAAPAPAGAPAAAGGPVSENVPVPGGTVAMARSLGIDPAPDRARFVAEIARLLHQGADGRNPSRATSGSIARRGNTMATPAPGAPADTVPIPLTVAAWSQSVFRRPVARDAIVAAIVADQRASHLCYGLAGLDDDTLQFLLDHPAAITRLYELASPAFAAFGSSLHIHENRVVVPGGAAAAAVWDAAVGESSASPEPFVRALFERDDGRLAYLYDAIAELDAPRRAFALGLSIADVSTRIRRFKELVAVNRAAIPQWQPAKLPFTRPLHDVTSLLTRVRVEADGSPSPPARRAAWTWIFDGLDLPAKGPAAQAVAADREVIDAAWLAQMILPADTRDRLDRLDQLAFAQRVFGQAAVATTPEALIAIRAFPRFRMLMLTLERSGVRQPAVYASAARRAQQLSSLDARRQFMALGQFQGALALIARMAGMRTLDEAATAALVTSLSDVPLNNDGRYSGALAKWIQRDLARVITARSGPAAGGRPDTTDVEALVLRAVAGVHDRGDGVTVEWEDSIYRVDIAASEERRLHRIREKQGRPTLDAALSTGDDQALADALMAWVYALSIADVDSPVLLTGTVTRRHDFGAGPSDRSLRLRTAWALPRQEIAVGVPWHVTGSLLGLDVALSNLALRRVGGDRAIDAPTLSSNERDAFAAAVSLLNPFELHDRDRDAIAAAVARGRARVAALVAGGARVAALIAGGPRVAGLIEDGAQAGEMAAEIHLDGWRRRALQWMLAHEPDRVGSIFSMTELLFLGHGPAGDLDAWGMSALAPSGCFCLRLAPPNQWRSLLGRPQLGLMAPTIADLNLHVAEMLSELHLPAAIAKSILSAAVQDFIDEVRPTDFNDWLTLVRAAQSVPRERVEDYVAMATTDGPLIPAEPE